jgi:NarL family two-component system sensor histidine kinase YdfH
MRNFLRLVYDSCEGERPFFFFLTLILSGMYFWVVFTTPALQQPGILVLFTLLMVLHIALHWLAPLLERVGRLIPAYILVQGMLAFAVSQLSGNQGMIFGTYLALIGEAFGILRMSSLWGVVAVGGYLLLSLVNFGLIVGWDYLLWWAVGVLPITLFIAIYVTLYSRQVEARARAQALLADLEIANWHLSEYAAQVEDLTIASERQRMARELHDTLSQGLAGVILQLEATDAHLAHDRPERAREILQQTMQQARATLSEARRAIGDLRQGHTAPVAMVELLREEVESFTRATGIPCELVLDLQAPVPDELCEPVLRSVSESLSNIARHSRASQATVRLANVDGHLLVEVRDDGSGFDPLAVGQGHYGLLGMRERVRLAGGSLQVISRPGEGTAVVLHLPLSHLAAAKVRANG